jgi:hypothetical protein
MNPSESVLIACRFQTCSKKTWSFIISTYTLSFIDSIAPPRRRPGLKVIGYLRKTTNRFLTDPQQELFAESVCHVVALMNTHERCTKIAHFECVEEQTGSCSGVNCCIAGFMSRCGAGPCVIDQHACKFFRKSSAGDRCMHYCVSIDGHCDCVVAQDELKRSGPPGN